MARSQKRLRLPRAAALFAAAATAAAGHPDPAASLPARFWSSFEAADPQPAWTDGVEAGADGRAKAEGVDGGFAAGIPGSLTNAVADVTASGESAPTGETKEDLVDGDVWTKWLVRESAGWVQLRLTEPAAVARYALTSANDAPERDPSEWSLLGSPDGWSWTTLDVQAEQAFAGRHETRLFRVARPARHLHYRLEVRRNQGDAATHLAELQLATDETPPAAPGMRTRIDAGPLGSPTATARVGFTGHRALLYAGSHTAAGRGHSSNKAFDANVRVTPATELSYLVFPALAGGDSIYRSTYVSVDLAFSDGTYLSELGALDQHGVRLDPRSQGESKTLSVDQWNYKRAEIGAVAAGKTVARVLVAYDNPEGAGPFRGWIDDVEITAEPARRAYARPSDYVLTTRGTHSSGRYSRGNTIPATAVPSGFNFWVPVTNAGSTSWLHEYHRSNGPDNLPALQALSVSHQPSPWMGDRQTFQVMPQAAAGRPDANRGARALAYRRANEVARPHYYSVRFENGVRAEIAPTHRAALLRFSFPGPDASLIFDNVDNRGGLTLDRARGVVTAYSDVRSRLSAGATRLFVYAAFDRPVTEGGLLPGGGGADVTGYLRFEAGAERVVTMRIATSLIGVEQARRNLELEIAPSDTVESVAERARRLWDEKLGVIEVEGASEDQLVTLYSNLYRLFLYPNAAFENTGTREKPLYAYASPVSPPAGPDTPERTGARIVAGKLYVNNGFWDTFRTAWPAYALFAPELAGELVEGFVQHYRDGGWIARWSSPGYADLMAGTSSDVAFADAYVKGVTGFDARDAYDAALKNATVVPPDPGVGRKGLATSVFLGYTTTATREGMSWALDGYVNDFGIANMARALAEAPGTPETERRRYHEEHEYFLERALNYVHMFDPSIGFFQGREPDGSWRRSPRQYDPRVWGHDYTETNGWNFAFTVPHDGQGLANLYGGRDGLAAKLDAFFAKPETAHPDFKGSYRGVIHEMVEARDVRMGQYGHSNQVSHHIIYMYNYAGQPWKAQQKAREVLDRLYLGSEIGQGYPGDEDNGEMSAWYLFSALGLYPLQVGSASYTVGSPLFRKATVRLPGGRRLVVRAPGNGPRNVYVQSLKLDGRPYEKTHLPHARLAEGAVLEFELGPQPSAWGSGEDEAPPSLTHGGDVARPLRDATEGGRAAACSGSGPGVDALFDDTSATRVSFASRTPWVQCRFEAARTVTFYTLTSGHVAGDPRSWRLEGSNDGTRWSVLDAREAEAFRWRRQTRPFKVARPGPYTHYRLEVAVNSGEPETVLAQIELLARPR